MYSVVDDYRSREPGCRTQAKNEGIMNQRLSGTAPLSSLRIGFQKILEVSRTEGQKWTGPFPGIVSKPEIEHNRTKLLRGLLYSQPSYRVAFLDIHRYGITILSLRRFPLSVESPLLLHCCTVLDRADLFAPGRSSQSSPASACDRSLDPTKFLSLSRVLKEHAAEIFTVSTVSTT